MDSLKGFHFDSPLITTSTYSRPSERLVLGFLGDVLRRRCQFVDLGMQPLYFACLRVNGLLQFLDD